MDGEGRLQKSLVILILCWGPVNIYPGYGGIQPTEENLGRRLPIKQAALKVFTSNVYHINEEHRDRLHLSGSNDVSLDK